jgi:hypothetical protein
VSNLDSSELFRVETPTTHFCGVDVLEDLIVAVGYRKQGIFIFSVSKAALVQVIPTAQRPFAVSIHPSGSHFVVSLDNGKPFSPISILIIQDCCKCTIMVMMEIGLLRRSGKRTRLVFLTWCGIRAVLSSTLCRWMVL